MRAWQDDLLHACRAVDDADALFAVVAQAGRSLGFAYCSYGMGEPVQGGGPRITILRNYPQSWIDVYESNGYLLIDPSVRHGLRTRRPSVWMRDLFDQAPEMWEHAREHGLHHGWAQSNLCPDGRLGMLTVAREAESISESELRSRETSLMWLTSVAHSALSELIRHPLRRGELPELTEREKSILGWTADGKTSADIGQILGISVHTVNHHFKQILVKLGVPNKAAAVAQAIRLGLMF